MAEGPRGRAGRGKGGRLEVVLTPSPSTRAVVPYFAVVNGLAAHGISDMDIGAVLDQDLHTAQQALTGCPVQGRGAGACLTVEVPPRGRGQEGRTKGICLSVGWANQLPGLLCHQPSG